MVYRRTEKTIRRLAQRHGAIIAAAAVGALLESLIGPLAPENAEGEPEPVQALTLYVLRGLGISDARARGLVVSRTTKNGPEAAAEA